MTLKELLDKKSAVTHLGKFHADDVFSTALIKILNPEIEVQRVINVPENFDGIAYDIGLGEFDHHQKDSEVRENGVPYAAFGLLWRSFGKYLMSESEAQIFDEKFVQPLDLDDNTGSSDPIAMLIGGFNPTWDSSDDVNERFWQAVEFAKGILQRKIEQSKSLERANELVKKALENERDGIVILDKFAPFKQALSDSDALFVVYPSQRGGFNAQAVPSNEPPYALKCPFPTEWRGLRDDEVGEVSGIESLRFCHNSGFLIAANTLEDAVKACYAAKEKCGENSTVDKSECDDCEVRPGKYRHFKGNEYEVLYTATHSESGEKMVVYRALYGDMGIWVRPAQMFSEKVLKDGVSVNRFEYIG